MTLKNDQYWMQQAIDIAKQAEIKNEVPVGAIIVKNNQQLCVGENKNISTSDPTAHAEIIAIRQTSLLLKNHRIPETTLYVTLEPCTMCFGAIIHARIQRVVFGAYDHRTGVLGSSINLPSTNIYNHTPEISGGILENECASLLKNFFYNKTYMLFHHELFHNNFVFVFHAS